MSTASKSLLTAVSLAEVDESNGFLVAVRAPLDAREINARGFESPGGFSPVHATLSPAGRKSPTTVWEPRGLKSHPTKKILRTQEKQRIQKYSSDPQNHYHGYTL